MSNKNKPQGPVSKLRFLMTVLAFLVPSGVHALDVAIPHIAGDSNRWDSLIQVDNDSRDAGVFTIALFDGGTEVHRSEHHLDGLTKRVFRVSDLTETASCGVISFEEPRLSFRMSFHSLDGGGVAEFVLTSSQSASLTFLFSDFDDELVWKGLALANLNAAPTRVTFIALGGGQILETVRMDLSGRTRITGLHTAWFPDLDFEAIERIVVVSDPHEVNGLAISGDQSNSRLLFSPAVALQDFDGSICGNTLCERQESASACPQDCDPEECWDYYDDNEALCVARGWTKTIVDVDGIERKLLWKGPPSIWSRGTVIALHGGGGAASNFCGDLALNEPLGAFSQLAMANGFGVVSLDSSYNRATDPQGRPVGKRWDCLAQHRANIDLPFIHKVITETVPSLRPGGSGQDVFLVGISNGGFTTLLAATHFSDMVTGFALVSSGDPYGAYFDMGTHPANERACAPGVFRDNETHALINTPDACLAESFENEMPWPTAVNPIPFKQFHHQGDGVCDFSCMEKARDMLIARGYQDDGAFVLTGSRSLWHHFWQNEYNQPLIEFFTKYAAKRNK